MALAVFAPSANGGGFVIALRGSAPDCVIVVASNAHETVQYAAKELQSFTKRMTGVGLPIVPSATGKSVILDYTAGEPPAPQASAKLSNRQTCKPDSFRLSVTNDCLRIVGGGPRGVLYGVYELLERFGGCEWFSSWVEEIPEREIFAVPGDLDLYEAPAFEERGAHWYDLFQSPAFAARCRFNGYFHQKPPYGGPALRFVKGLGFQLAHTYGKLVPAKEYFAEHPEWYSMVGGRRLGPDEEWQLCWTNKELQHFVAERCKELLRADPGAMAVGVSQNDWFNYCSCPNCAAVAKAEGSPAGPNILFANAVAEEIEDEFPGVTIFALAYHGTRKPPKTIRPRRNVGVVLCSFECSFTVPFEKSTHPNSAAFCDYLREWGMICGNLYVWDYCTNFRNYLMPHPSTLSLAPNYRLFRDNRVRWLFTQGSDTCPHADCAELKCYLQSKLMWNPDQPVEPLVSRFLKAFYGPAAPVVGECMDRLHAALNASPYRDPDPDAAPAAVGLYGENLPLTDDFLEEALAMFHRAEEAVKDDPARLYNVRVAELPIVFTRLKRLYERGCKKVWVAEYPAPHLERIEALRSACVDFLSRADEVKNAGHGVLQLSESNRRNDFLMKEFQLATKAPIAVSPACRTEVTTNLMSCAKSEKRWELPLRLIACDEGATYHIRARIRGRNEFSSGFIVPGLPLAKGTQSRCFKSGATENDDWAWRDIGEYDLSALQKLPRPTLDGLCFFVCGDIDFDRIEIAKVK